MLATILEFDCTGRNTFEFVAKGDGHVGNITHSHETARHVNQQIAEEQLPWLDVGDMIEAITSKDHRFYAREVDEKICSSLRDLNKIVHRQIDHVVKTHQDIANLAMLYLDSNHYVKAERFSDLSVYETIMAKLEPTTQSFKRVKGTHALGYCGWLILRLSRGNCIHTVRIYLHHGYFAGRMGGGKTNNLERLLGGEPFADIVIIGHGHDYIPRLLKFRKVLNSGKIVPWYRLALMVPSMLETYSDGADENYAARAGLPDTITGAAKITIDLNNLRADVKNRTNPYHLELIQ